MAVVTGTATGRRPGGQFLANFKRRGIHAGDATARLKRQQTDYEFHLLIPPNDYGLYNVAGNVNGRVGTSTVVQDGGRLELLPQRPLSRNYSKKGYQSLIDDHVRVQRWFVARRSLLAVAGTPSFLARRFGYGFTTPASPLRHDQR